MNCAVCGCGESAGYLVSGRHRLVRCGECGLIYVPDFEEPSYSGEEYFLQGKDYVRRWDEFSGIFDALLDKIREFRKEGALLDVGAGVGTLVHVASKKGFAAKGVEISEWASAYARNERGLDVRTGALEEARFDAASFDVVVVNHVLEHVKYPKAMLSEIHRVLRNDGLLVIGVPNIGSIMAKLRGSRWVALLPAEHRWHFTPATLARLVEGMDFEILRLEAKDNPPVAGWGLKDTLRRGINALSVMADRSESMLAFAAKKAGQKP